jgi:hypothetical protein
MSRLAPRELLKNSKKHVLNKQVFPQMSKD